MATDNVMPFVRMPRHETQDRLDVASQDVAIAAADFFIAIQEAVTARRALQIRERLAGLVLQLQAAESAALEKADQLCGKAS